MHLLLQYLEHSKCSWQPSHDTSKGGVAGRSAPRSDDAGSRILFRTTLGVPVLVPVRDSPVPSRKKENGHAKGGMGGRHAATTQGFLGEVCGALAVLLS